MSALAGFLAALWRDLLDPNNTGASILAFPTIVVMFLVCVTFSIVGLLARKKPYGLPLILASMLIPISFLAINRLVD